MTNSAETPPLNVKRPQPRTIVSSTPSITVLTIRRLLRNNLGRLGLIVVAFLILVGLFAPWLAPYDPIQQHEGMELTAPSAQFLLGTDELGRDLLSRIIYGARISLVVGVAAVAFGAVVGISTGLLAGYSGGWGDAIVMRIWDTVMAFPGILLGIAIAAILGPGLFNAGIAVGILSMPSYARMARAGMLTEQNRDYVIAARAMGTGRLRIIFQHILPNALAPILTQVALGMAGAVFLEAGMSFLGLGAQPPRPSWGSMIAQSRAYLRLAPWYGIAPGVAISLFLIGLNALADGLRDALDPTHIEGK
ncbi:MAG TPA: ABC transporter permease [Caldilineaceae bacterium]|nr:ABC transporter permease [Caldilineaceae bacterium]